MFNKGKKGGLARRITLQLLLIMPAMRIQKCLLTPLREKSRQKIPLIKAAFTSHSRLLAVLPLS
jgi:hypothetical protein